MKTKVKLYDEKKGNVPNILLLALNAIPNNIKYYWCENCENIIEEKNDHKPKICTKCGSELDWDEILMKIIKECPRCKKQYENNASNNYCQDCLPIETLFEKSIPR